MRQRYRFKAAATGPHEILIYGDIGEQWDAAQSNDAKSLIMQLGELSAADDIIVRINSYGGSVSDGIAIYNALERHQGTVITHVDGVAFSIASMIAMAGDDCQMASNALMMIHAPWGGVVGNAAEMRDMAGILDKYAEAMSHAYVRNGEPEIGIVRGWLSDGEDHFFTATEAAALGLVDVIGEPTGMPIAASLRDTATRFNLPAPLARIYNPEADSMASDTKTQGGQTGAPTEENQIDLHNRTVQAAMAEGQRRETQRRQMLDNVFAQFLTGDELDPVTAVHRGCENDPNCDEIEARRRLLDVLGKRSADPVLTPRAYTHGSQSSAPPGASAHLGGFQRPAQIVDGTDKAGQGIRAAIEIRAGLVSDRAQIDKERSNEFLGMALTDLMAREMRGMGRQVGGSRETIARAYLDMLPVMAAGTSHGTDHLTGILADVANKSAMMGWDGAEETWAQWTVAGQLNDYREAQRANLALLDKLDQMLEHQEWEYGDLADVKQGLQGYFYGKKYGLSIQAIVNDDLGELTRAFNAWGEAASATVGDAVFALLTTAGSGGYGQTMDEDSQIVFHADHSNYIASGSGAAPSITTLAAGRTAMITQTDQNSRTVGIRPRYILHGAALQPTVWTLLASQNNITGATSVTQGEANWAAASGMQSIEEYRFDGFVSTSWILAAARRTIEVAGVAGPLAPRVERSAISNIPGITYEMSMPFGCAALDYRGLYFNYGA